MAYCTISEVSIHGTPANKPYSSSTVPTSTQVTNSIIPYIARYIDGRLKAVSVTVPVVQANSPLAYALLTDINALGAAAKALRIAYTKQDPNKSDWVDRLWSEFKERLDSVCDKPAVLQDAAPANGNVGISGAPDAEHRFYRGHDW